MLQNSSLTKLINTFLVIGLCLGGISSSLASLQDEYLVETWTSRDGLPHNSINAISQTQDGYLWFATWEGIARFNGREFKLFTRGQESALIDSGVQALYTDPDGGLLAGDARGGLIYRKPYNWQALPPVKNLVNAVLRQSDGGIWIGLRGEGLIFRAHDHAENQLILPALSVYNLSLRQNGGLLASTSQGLYLISSDKIENVSQSNGLKNTPVYSAVEDAQGRIIFGGETGAWRYQDGRLSRIHDKLNNIFVSNILIDSQGNYWFGTFSQGIYRFSANNVSSLTELNGVPHNQILSLYQDRESSIWVGTHTGLIRLRQTPFSTWDKSRGLAGDYIRTVLALDSGEIIVGSSRGLSVIQNGQPRNYSAATSDHLAPETLSVMSLALRQNGGVWVGSYNHGLFSFDNQMLKHVELQGLPANVIRAIVEDNQGQLWVGTTAGLVRYSSDGTHQLFTTKDGLPDNFIMALTLDEQGQLWIGTGLGVGIINQNLVRNLNLQPLEKAEYVFGFHAQKEYMWMTTDRGLIRYRFSDQTLSIIGQKNGLPIDKLFQVIPDRHGYLWLTSNRGILRISADEANAVADGTRRRIHFDHYNERDGMATAQLNGGSNPTAAIDASGQLWFATAKGVASTHPQRFKQLVSPKFPTVIERVRSDQTWLNLTDEQPSVLPAGSQRMTFDFVGLGYISSQHIRYRTKLEGLDSQWIERGSQGFAEYTNLAPGHYRFVVNAYYPYHPNEVNQASFSFRIIPHWWQRKNIQLGLALLVIFSFALFVWWRLRLLRQSELRLKYEVAQKTQALQVQASAFEKQAREDQLTGLHNRRAFDEWIDQVISTSRPNTALSIVMLDIDHFKKINDTYTHLAGDQVLRTVGKKLGQFSQNDCFIARWGGEEFVMGIVGWQPHEVRALCEKINLLVKEQDYSRIAVDLAVTISIGIVNADTSHDFAELLCCADKALFKVKKSGRDGVFVH
ncbi:ligand-binding sensor domain-containing protein [Photobacterium lipolyticum]|uniref:diguanylate cyclase n=1 Tax=Photobacterium lipolyticum TaxID=266810 RepID=A0A2T3N019_9GAMM|nr:ligand-binding sensor domain-containing diguanylate cyclase [Photobacterium lipolyticum]PSW05591.1 GGDEF domain-containing protein [Photobacterium lipolyticum]